MNWCNEHWTVLRKAIADRGLSKFGAQSAEAALEEIAMQIEGEEESFDPLIGSWSRINIAMAKSLQKLGRSQEILLLRCPLCILVEDGQPQTVDNWVNGVADDAKLHAIAKGFIKVDG